MKKEVPSRLADPLRQELSALRSNPNSILILGVVLVVLGTILIGSPIAASLGSMMFLSTMLIISGIGQLVGAFWVRHWSGAFLQLLAGILYLVLGVLTFERPLEFEITLTLLIASLLIVGGTSRLAAAIALRFEGWIWPVVNGAISLLLGVMIWRQWPLSGLYVIGLFLGLEVLFQGVAWIALGLAVRRMVNPAESREVAPRELPPRRGPDLAPHVVPETRNPDAPYEVPATRVP